MSFLSSIFGGDGWSAPLVNGLFNVATSVAGNIFSSKAKKDAAKETEKAALDEQLSKE